MGPGRLPGRSHGLMVRDQHVVGGRSSRRHALELMPGRGDVCPPLPAVWGDVGAGRLVILT